MKTKECQTCNSLTDTAYRIQIEKGKNWIFVCPDCIKSHQKSDFYRYGGTWKGYRH